MYPDNVTPAVLRKLAETRDTPRTWHLSACPKAPMPYARLCAYEARMDKALRRDVVAHARGCLAELPELVAIVVQAHDYYRRKLIVTRDKVRLVTGSTGLTGGSAVWNNGRFDGTIPPEAL